MNYIVQYIVVYPTQRRRAIALRRSIAASTHHFLVSWSRLTATLAEVVKRHVHHDTMRQMDEVSM